MIVITICNIFDLLRLFAYRTVPSLLLNNIKAFIVRSLVIANLSPFYCQPPTIGEQYEQMMSVMRSVSYVYVPNTYRIITGMPEIEHGDDDDNNIYNRSSRLATTITVMTWKCVRSTAHRTEIQFSTFIRQSRTILNVSSVSNSFDKIQFAARFNCLFTLLIRV